jgi:hypothetical protein
MTSVIHITLFKAVCLLAISCNSSGEIPNRQVNTPFSPRIPSISHTPSPELPATPIGLYLEEEHRDLYKTLYTHESTGYPSWNEEYQAAVQQNSSWLTNAQEVALHFLPSIYGEWSNLREKVYSLPADSGESAFIIVQSGGDDSMGQTKYRLELVQSNDIWKIRWVGWMRRCARGVDELQTIWHTQSCP